MRYVRPSSAVGTLLIGVSSPHVFQLLNIGAPEPLEVGAGRRINSAKHDDRFSTSQNLSSILDSCCQDMATLRVDALHSALERFICRDLLSQDPTQLITPRLLVCELLGFR